jgi:hypothetical protein
MMETGGSMGLGGLRVLQALRRALEGLVTVRLADPSISARDVYCGIVAFSLDGLRVAFYFDCADLDYCEWAEDGAGQRGEFDGWFDQGEEPVAMLDEVDQERLRQLLVEAV